MDAERVFLSWASAWEIAEDAVEILEISTAHLLQLEKMPHHHRDPFDRMIVAQPLEANLPIIRSDSAFDAYGVRRIF